MLFINSELEFEEGKNQNKLREQDIAKIVEVFENFTEIKRYSKVVDISEIEENDFNLNIRRYADTSPPPEIFDVRAILHGGIPVREVEDDYIQEEILKGCDLSKVLQPVQVNTVRTNTVRAERDEGAVEVQVYLEFKPEIKNKEQISALMGDSSSEAIKQLEHWWDKYKVSLHELDEQVAEAESVMKGFLQELGYE